MNIQWHNFATIKNVGIKYLVLATFHHHQNGEKKQTHSDWNIKATFQEIDVQLIVEAFE